jgi:hypothetical protein
MTAHGAAIYDYSIDGVRNRAFVPPKGFDPLNASDAHALAYAYGISDESGSFYTRWCRAK